MKIYKVELDISLVVSRLKNFELKEFNSPFPLVFVEANNADEACHLAYFKFASVILNQDSSFETAELVSDILLDVSIKKATVAQ
jgi:hypothetical protein